MKKRSFNFPFIGYDYGKSYQVKYDVLIGEFGNPVIGIKIKNIVEQYAADKELYLKYHTALQNVISIIGEGRIVQKLDIFDKKRYKAEECEEFLQQKYSDHFEGRVFKTIDTLLLFTDIVHTAKKKTKYKATEKRYKDLRDKADKVFLLFKQQEFEPEWMQEKDFKYFLNAVLSMNFDQKLKVLDNIKAFDDHIQIGNKIVKTISFVDVENIDLPNEITPYTRMGGNSAIKNTAVDNFSFINSLQDYSTIIYNQILHIPYQTERVKFLSNKRNRHEGFKNEPANRICSEEITALLENIALDGQLIVDAHFSLIVGCQDMQDMEQTQSIIENSLFQKGIITSKNTYNQLELFRTALTGNATELKEYDLFTTTSEASLCFFF